MNLVLYSQCRVYRGSRAIRQSQTWKTQRKRNTLLLMKSAIIPQVRVEPALRDELEAVLNQGETLSEFVEASVRNAVAFRRVQSQFLERGQAAWEDYQSTGRSVPAVDMVAKLQARLDARRKQLTR
jgi:hypothetical protein